MDGDIRRRIARHEGRLPHRVLMLGILILLGTLPARPSFGQAISGDGTLVYAPPSAADEARQIAQAAAFFPLPGLNPENRRIVLRLTTNAYRIAAWPQAGFNYDYYLYVPDDFASNYLLAASIASGGAIGMGPDYYSEWAKKVVVDGSWETQIAKSLKAPLLYPAFDRPDTVSAQYLSRDAMLLAKDRISRLDLQFISMVDDARSFIAAEFGVELDRKILLAGFSMSAEFAGRFTVMHPERVRAAAYGGTSFMHLLPYTRDIDRRVDLIYPIGVSDIARISGRAFDREAYLKVPRYLTMGLQDTEDVTRYGGLYPGSMRSWIDSRLGSLETRWNAVTRLLGELGGFECKLYRDKGHRFDTGDYVAFLQRYNSFREPRPASPAPATKASPVTAASMGSLGGYQVITGNPSVIVKPAISIDSSGFISSIALTFSTPRGVSIPHPASLVRRIQIQIDVRPDSGYPVVPGGNPNRAYDSPLLAAVAGIHIPTRLDIPFEMVTAIYISYEDLSGNQFLIVYKAQ
jgi:hypothetical protein